LQLVRPARDRGRGAPVWPRSHRLRHRRHRIGCEWTSKALAEAEIGEEAREKILHRNAAAMLSPLATIAPLERAAA